MGSSNNAALLPLTGPACARIVFPKRHWDITHGTDTLADLCGDPLPDAYSVSYASANPALPPAKPKPRDIPKTNHLGEDLRGLALPAAMALKLPGGEVIALYGYIVGKRDGSSNYIYWNKAVGAECRGKTALSDGGYGSGEFFCTRQGRDIMRGPFVVVPQKYRKLRGEVKATFDFAGGSQVQVNLAWRAAGFPKLRDVLEGF
ncbi:hypothetical protein ASD8599_03261 [Ascidiaceihabitans donghaensis]|uniref:Uncharacterized protein n=1 Tax=Ascidiaceihabitans donghaensis TaxID=1510460 RepID=A0A2R8BHM5_9RHOB|nr:hypothetical protein [Ascidiaceihabitans donghaensis]SPH22517.1 hypothetical protein ASD8599_03261 [Ascidiaceihabitans donghaensis]